MLEGLYRRQSVEKTMREISAIRKQYDVDLFAFYDPIFAHCGSRMREYYEGLKKYGLLGKIFLYVQFMAGAFDEEMARIISGMFAYRIYFGFESGSEKILRFLKTGIATVEDNRRVCRLADKYDLRIDTCFMIGVPGETVEDLEQTENFIRQEYLNHVQISHTVPQPGTALWNYCLEKGLIPPGPIDWDIMEPKPHDTDANLIYLNPGLEKAVYLQINQRIRDLAEEKTRQGQERVQEKFDRDCAVVDENKSLEFQVSCEAVKHHS